MFLNYSTVRNKLYPFLCLNYNLIVKKPAIGMDEKLKNHPK